MAVCNRITADGRRCRATALHGSDACFFHDPDMATARKAAQRAGGIERSRAAAVLPADAPNLPLTTVQDVIALLGETVNQVRRGEIDPRVSNAVGYLAGLMLKALEQGPIEERLALLESVMKAKTPDASAAYGTPGRTKFDVRPGDLVERTAA